MTTAPELEAEHKPDPAPRRRHNLIVSGLAVLLLAVTGGGVYVALGNTDEARIRQVVGDFATTVDRQDYPAMLALLCDEEAAGITEDDDYDPTAEPIEPAGVPERQVTDIRIAPEKQTATALVTTPGRAPVTVHLRPERDQWKVCAPAAG